MNWKVLGVATVSLWGILLQMRGDLELAKAPTNPCYHHIDAAYYCSIYYRLTHFVSAHVNKIHHTVLVQWGYMKLHPIV